MFDKLEKYKSELANIERELTRPEIIKNQHLYATYMKKRGELLRYVSRYNKLLEIRKQIKENEEIIQSASEDKAFKDLADEDLKRLHNKEQEIMSELQELFLSEDEDSSKNVIMEIRPGTGGEEAALFAGDLFRMYSKYAERKNWTIQILHVQYTDLKGIKHITFSVAGNNVYQYLHFESGTHRVQRVPVTETSGRIHTSASTVAVLPEPEEIDIEIKPDDIEISTFRASGPGGQHVNKVSSAVRIRHLSTGIIVSSQSERSQHRNKEIAMRLLRTRLYEQLQKQQKDKIDYLRRTQIGTGDRSEKIRTYNFPQNRVTDHRINFSIYDLEAFMDGHMDEMIEKLLEIEKEKRLKMIS